MGNAKRAHQLTRQPVIEFGGQIGIPANVAERELERLLASTQTAGVELLHHLPAGSHAGEIRLTRQIVYGVIKDMSLRLHKR